MSDVSDISELLEKAQRELRAAKRSGTTKAVLAALCTVLGTAAGSGWAARGYLENLATKADVAALAAGQVQQVKDLQAVAAAQGDRLTKVETVAGNGADCCHESTRRIDGILGGSMLPMRRP